MNKEQETQLDLFGFVEKCEDKRDFIPGMDKQGIYFVALGGAEKVGMNMYAYIVDGHIIVVDTGYDFLNDDFPGIDLGLADASFLENYQDRIEGVFITHSHEDHFGAIAHIWPRLHCPVYATDFTLGHIRPRLAEYDLENFVELHSVNENPIVKLNNFEVEFVPVVHSLPENSALFIRTRYGTVFHATDWRFDNQEIGFMKTDYQRLEEIGQEGVDLYVGDSIPMAHHNEQTLSESDIRKNLMEMMPRFENTLVATCFASNIARMESLILAAHAVGRTPVIAGRSLVQNMKIAKDCGFLADLPPYTDAAQAMDIPLDKMLYICAGSQGNYRSGLTRIVNGENKNIKLGKGDAIIFSSQIIPGNEEKIERMQEKLRDAGVEVISTEEYAVHTSGHGTKEDIVKMFSLIKPRTIIPVHGDKRSIRQQKRFAQELGINVIIARDGDVVLIDKQKAEIVGEVPVDELAVDRKQIISLNSQLIKNRKRIAYNCSLYIGVVLSENWQVEDLQIMSIDILEEKEFIVLADEIKKKMLSLIPQEAVKLNYRLPQIRDFIQSKIRKMVYAATDIKPVTFLHFYKRDAMAPDVCGETEA